MKKNYLIIIVLSVLNIILLYKFFNLNAENKELISLNHYFEIELQTFNAAKQLFIYYIIDNGKYINPEISFYDSDNKELTLDKIMATDSINFFIHIPSGGCHTCVPEMLRDISIKGLNDVKNLYFFTSFMDNERLKEIEIENTIKIYNLKEHYLGFLSERENKYFIFSLDKSSISKKFHILDGNLKEITSKYFRYCDKYIN